MGRCAAGDDGVGQRDVRLAQRGRRASTQRRGTVMAYVLLPLNGIGRGHLTRALIFSDWLRQAGRLPMIALQGSSRYSAAPSVPTTNIPSLYRMEEDKAQRVADDLAQVAMMSGPSVIIEDTHPRRVRWPRELRHLVVVRPTRIDHMRLLNRGHGATAGRLLVCD